MLQKLRWEKLQGQEIGRAGHTATLVGSRIFVFGGRNGGDFFNDLWAFDTETEQWKLLQEHAPFAPRAYHSATLVGDKDIWLIGGSDAKKMFSDVYVLRTDVLEWSTPQLRNQSLSRGTHAAVVHPLKSSCILVYGGYGGPVGKTPTWLEDLCVLDTATLSWNEIPSEGCLPGPRGYHSLTVFGQNILLFGGKNSSGTVKEKYASVFDAAGGKWCVLKSLGEKPSPRSNHVAGLLKDHLVVIHGGREGTVRLNDMYLLQVSSSFSDEHVFKWHKYFPEKPSSSKSKTPKLVGSPEGRAAHCLVVRKEAVYVIAGYGGEKKTFSDVYVIRHFPYPGFLAPPKSRKSSLLPLPVDTAADNGGWLSTKRKREENDQPAWTEDSLGASDPYEWAPGDTTAKRLHFTMEQTSVKKCSTTRTVPSEEIKALRRDKASLEREVEATKKELQALRGERDQLKQSVQLFQEQAEEGNSNAFGLQRQVDSLLEDLRKTRNELQAALELKEQEKLEQVRLTEQKLGSSIEHLKALYEDAVLERDEYKSCIQKLEAELQKQMQTLQQSKTNFEAERNILLQEIAERKGTADRIFTELGMSKESSRAMQENVQRLARQLEETNRRLDQCQKDKQELNRANGALTAELKQAGATKSAAESSLQLVKMELESARTLLEQNAVEMRKMKDRADEDAAHINTCRSSLKKTQEQLNSQLEEAERLRNLVRDAEEFEKTQLRLVQGHVEKLQCARQASISR